MRFIGRSKVLERFDLFIVVVGACMGAVLLALGMAWLSNLAETNSRTEVRLTLNSKRVRSLVSQQDAISANDHAEVFRYWNEQFRTASYLWNPEIYIPERIAFLDAMDKEPAIVVPPKSWCWILRETKATCNRGPNGFNSYGEVLMISGPAKGQVVWGCLSDSIVPTMMWP